MHRATVAVGVGTVWTGPEAARDVDSPALSTPAHPRHWLNAMTTADRADLNGRTLTQVRLGESVLVDEVRGEWTRIIAPRQSTDQDERGYPGWLPSAQLTEFTPADEADYVVDATSIALLDEPNGDVTLPAVVLGTRLTSAGPSQRGWAPIRVPGVTEPLWGRLRDLRAADAPAPDAMTVAWRMLDVPYVWGGLSAYGIDCSGLVYVALGGAVPRDAADQYAAATPVERGTEQAGDLYFFARDGQPVHHVGFVVGDGRMLHACGTTGRVVCEELTAERVATLLGIGRL
ncbi:C40 family peptidase [Longispora sp. NPDC051575]|uniref:C40 family peptidase n=1 Tax=Longispora sp. NPDC051575 TaxID=3154943 RepID=UPI00341AE577